MRKTFAVSFTALLALVLAILAFVPNDTFDSHYSSLEEAIADGAVARGWIPGWLPQSATSIHETHNIDSNRIYIALDYGVGDQNWHALDCAQPSGQSPENPEPRVNWWPKSTTRVDWGKLEFLTCKNHAFGYELFLAVDRTRRRAFLWTTH